MKKRKPYCPTCKPEKLRFETLEPGCLVVYYDPERIKPHEVRMTDAEWKNMQKMGFYGGIMLPHFIRLTSLNDQELASCGLIRVGESEESHE